MEFSSAQLRKAEEEITKKRKFGQVTDTTCQEVAGFVRTLFNLLKMCDEEIIQWTDDGEAVTINDPTRFACEICPKFFRHRNFNSFTRILNMYQFHKIPNNEKNVKKVKFIHPCFKRNHEELLHRIQRKGANKISSSIENKDTKKAEEDNIAPENKKLKLDLAKIKGKRTASIFPSGASIRTAATSALSLVSKEVWEKTNAEITEREMKEGYLSKQTMGDPSAVSTWMRRVVELERETRRLKKENSRLKGMQGEMAGLRAQLDTQSEMIRNLQLQLGSPMLPSFVDSTSQNFAISEKMTAALLEEDNKSNNIIDPNKKDSTSTDMQQQAWDAFLQSPQLLAAFQNSSSTSSAAKFREIMSTNNSDETLQACLQPMIDKFSGPEAAAQQQILAQAVANNPFMSQCFAHCLSELKQH
mmetsp:Transcript_12780/g.17165  ORF Transcript_12780/g.17165 Transcript_12780/m.17165 type:complete len:415 (-) Transcript_12780:387-1631(-)